MMKVPYGKQSIGEDDIQAVTKVLTSEFLTQGPEIPSFEKAFSNYVGSKYTIAVNSGTAALHLAAIALGVNRNSKIIAPSLSFSATTNSMRYCEADIDFVDIDPKTFCIDLDLVEEKLSQHPGAYDGFIVVDFAGLPANLIRAREIADKYNVWFIEDACHAPGAQVRDENGKWDKVGSGNYADATAFSFHPVKHIAAGEGGALTTNRSDIAEKALLFRTHGIEKGTNPSEPWLQQMVELGFNYRMPDIIAALAHSQLKKLAPNIENRQEIAKKYNEKLKELPIELPSVPENLKHAFHLYVIKTEHRAELYQFLREKNIYTQIHYYPIHRMPYYQGLKSQPNLPHTDEYYAKCLSIPMFHSISEEEQMYVIDSLKEFFRLKS